MIEEEVCEIWVHEARLMRPISFYWDRAYTERVARYDYQTAIGLLEDTVPWRKGRCKRTLVLLKERILEALTSSSAYIRQWGRLIGEEKDGK